MRLVEAGRLGLGRRIGTFLFDGILGSQHQEGLVKGIEVGWQKVRGELDALKLGLDGLGQGTVRRYHSVRSVIEDWFRIVRVLTSC